MQGSMVLKCTCEYQFQDKKYGTRKRLHTVSGTAEFARCTVCGDKKRLSGKKVEEKAK